MSVEKFNASTSRSRTPTKRLSLLQIEDDVAAPPTSAPNSNTKSKLGGKGQSSPLNGSGKSASPKKAKTLKERNEEALGRGSSSPVPARNSASNSNKSLPKSPMKGNSSAQKKGVTSGSSSPAKTRK